MIRIGMRPPRNPVMPARIRSVTTDFSIPVRRLLTSFNSPRINSFQRCQSCISQFYPRKGVNKNGEKKEKSEKSREKEIVFQAVIPVEKHIVKKNNRPIFKIGNRPILGKTVRLKKAEDDFVNQLLLVMKSTPKVQGPVQLTLIFFFKNYFTKKEERNKKIPDLDNLIALPQDAIVKAGLLTDDYLVQSYDGSGIYPAESNFVFIEIKEISWKKSSCISPKPNLLSVLAWRSLPLSM